VLPLWIPLCLTAFLPTLWSGRLIKARRRRRMGLCLSCGYDLRATPLGGCCPECGTNR
jgi:DNA polymerase II large subunit